MLSTSRALAALLIAAPAALASDLVPLGPPFVLTSTTANVQKQPWVAARDDGAFVVVYSQGDMFARIFDRNGAPLGPDFKINPTINSGEQDEGYVALDPITGDIAVGWSDRQGNDGFQMGCGARFLAANGTPYSQEQIVNVHTEFSQFEPYLAWLVGGKVLAAWADAGADGSCGCIGRLFNRYGTPLGGEILLNEPSPKTQIDPAVSSNRTDTFVCAYVDASGNTGEPREVMVRLFDQNLVPKGPSILVNSFSPGMQRDPVVAMCASGEFVVVFQDESALDGDSFGIFARCFKADGTPKGPQFQVNQATAGIQRDPHVCCDYVGNFVVTWEDASGGNYDVKIRRYDRDGAPLSNEIAVSTAATGDQTYAKSAMSQNGQRVVTVWFDSNGGDDYGRIFALGTLAIAPPLARGQTSTIDVDLPGMGGKPYVLLPALATSPAILVTGGRFLALAPDALLLFALSMPNSVLATNLAGTLDASGHASAKFTIPNVPAAAGLPIHFAALTLDGGDVGYLTDTLDATIQ